MTLPQSGRRALIVGVSGQDGAYLARLLLDKGYTVIGTSRDAQINPFTRLERLNIRDRVSAVTMSPIDFRSVLQVVTVTEPHEIYNLAGQSSVGLSFTLPVETLESIAVGTLNLLEVIRYLGKPIRFYNASSGECFGDTPKGGANEQMRFQPRSPYAVAKATSHWETANYRDAYNLYACSGILFNHESALRPERFVTQKIVAAVCRMAAGSKETLKLGALDIHRDWGWAPEYVEAMWAMLQQDEPREIVVATGHSHSLRDFMELAFDYAGVAIADRVESDSSLLRPSDITHGCGDPRAAAEHLGWTARSKMPDVVRKMIDARREDA